MTIVSWIDNCSCFEPGRRQGRQASALSSLGHDQDFDLSIKSIEVKTLIRCWKVRSFPIYQGH